MASHYIHIIGGGTFSHVRNHLALAAPAFGSTARWLHKRFTEHVEASKRYPHAPQALRGDWESSLILTKMADSKSNLVTNEDVERVLDGLVTTATTRVIILNAALCDYEGHVDLTASGSHAPRLKTAEGDQILNLTPAKKLIGKLRKERKDIFVVGFKTTTGATPDEQYRIALDMLKANSLNLVLANDTVTRHNMIVAPEETRYFESFDREEVLEGLVQMVVARAQNTFTRSTVVDGEPVAWDSELVPENLRSVVNHCIDQGAYKTFRDVTAGHFAVKLNEGTILTSKRKHDFNKLREIGLVKVEYAGDDRVVAYGAKPSVGGQSQRIIFREHPELDCIVHFHCPLKENHPDAVPVAPQWQNECGSHQCGTNTSRNLRAVGERPDLKVVMLDGHGPNVVFSRHTPANDVIDFIERNFDLKAKTGGLVA